MASLGTVFKHVVLSYDPESDALTFAPGSCRCPFGIVDCHHSTVFATHFGFHHALFFGFDFDQFGSHHVVSSAISDQEVWHIDSLLASQRMTIRDCYALAGPLKHMVVCVAKAHEAEFPT